MTGRHTFNFGPHQSTVLSAARDELYAGISEPCFYVADINTQRYLPPDGPRVVMPAGEGAKAWSQLENMIGEMLAAGLSRDRPVVAVGGGVICDVASFAASIYMRGCDLVLVPTTLLSMVDAAVGGKTGVNFGGYKNMVGTFYPAREVRLCAELLYTLPQREYLSGLGEMIKTAMIGDAELLTIIEENVSELDARDDELLEDAVSRCVMVKGAIVESDLRETGDRMHLNLGHTFAHALETVSGLGLWSHGEAVAWGLARAMEAGVAAGVTEPGYAKRVIALLSSYGFRIEPVPHRADELVAAMRKDKKVRGGRLRFVLQGSVADTRVVELEEALVRSVLENGVDLS